MRLLTADQASENEALSNEIYKRQLEADHELAGNWTPGQGGRCIR